LVVPGAAAKPSTVALREVAVGRCRVKK
jgi:hypothetical protein